MLFVIVILTALLFTTVRHYQRTIRFLRKDIEAYAEGNIEIEESYQQMLITADEEITDLMNQRDYLQNIIDQLRAEKDELQNQVADTEQKLGISEQITNAVLEELPRDALILPDVGKKGLY